MAMFEFLGKKKEEENRFQPKSKAVRGPGGRFISKKSLEEPPTIDEPEKETSIETDTTKKKVSVKETKTPSVPKGPLPITFYGSTVRRYFVKPKWYFVMADILAISTATPPPEPFDILLNKEDFKEFRDQIKVIEGLSCMDFPGASDFLTALQTTFPGPIKKWLTSVSSMPYREPAVKTDNESEDNPNLQINPSDRG
jgi:hypothetical protein